MLNPIEEEGSTTDRTAQSISSEVNKYRGERTLDPLPRAHHGLRTARCVDAVHVDVIRSDHLVDVNQTAVRAVRRELFLREAVTILQACAVGLPQGNVAGSILVE